MGAVATSMEDRILSALAAAGTDGLDREALLDATLGEEDVEPAEEAACNRLIGDLIGRGMVHLRTQGVHILTLSHAEWARLIVADATIPLTEGFTASLAAVISEPAQTKALEREIARILAGTDQQ